MSIKRKGMPKPAMKLHFDRIWLLAGSCLLSLIFFSCTANLRSEGQNIPEAEDVSSVIISTDVSEQSKDDDVTITVTLPLFSSHAAKTPIALVNDEPVMLGELRDEMKSLHAEMGQDAVKKEIKGSLEGYLRSLLDRIINTRLILEEARNIGLDEQRVIQTSVQNYSDRTLKRLLFTKHLDEVDIEIPEDEVTRLYQDAIREYNLTSILFKNSEDAEQASRELSSGADFYALMKNLVEKGVAQAGEKGENYVKSMELLPHVLAQLRRMDVGETSPVIKGGGKQDFVIFRIEDIRYTENPGIREEARQRVVEASRDEATRTFIDSLVEKYAILDTTLLGSINFDVMKKDSGALNDDTRVVATIGKAEHVTVGDVATYLEKEAWHGVETLTESLNERKKDALLSIVQKNVIQKEALSRCLDTSEEYESKIIKYENGLLFGSFIDKVIKPDVKISYEEAQAYYTEHQNEYMSPEMIRIDSSLVFSSRHHAENAARKLMEGTDFRWLLNNAEGQAEKDPDTLLDLEGRFLMLSSLPADMLKVVADAKKGQARVYESPEGDFYVLNILDELPAQPRPFAEVTSTISKRLYNEKLHAAVDAYLEKLKEFYDVKILVNFGK